MWIFGFLLLSLAQAQDDSQLKAIRDLKEELPSFEQFKMSADEAAIDRRDNQFRPPIKVIPLEKIIASGTQLGAVPAGSPIKNILNHKDYSLSRLSYVKFFNLEDELGFKYLQNENGTITWRVHSSFVEPIKHEISLYVPPLKYTPAPTNIVRAEYDKKLTIRPEVSFYAGLVSGTYMADLFDDTNAQSGVSNQYGVQAFTDWKLPIKIGASLHYEKATYQLSGNGQIIYSSFSIGPQIKSADFEFMKYALRVQSQFRFSPLAKAAAETNNGSQTFKFNSYDLLTSLEHPIKNRFGEFILGLYFQAQWLNIKDQTELVNIEATNETNKSFGLSFSQVF